MRYNIDYYTVYLTLLDDYICINIKNLKNNFEYQEIISSNDYQYLKLDNELLYNLLNYNLKNENVILKNNNYYVSLYIKLENVLDNFKIKIPRYFPENPENKMSFLGEKTLKIKCFYNKVPL